MLAARSVVAEVNGQLWDMHRPLEYDCTLRFLHMKMKDEDCAQVNATLLRLFLIKNGGFHSYFHFINSYFAIYR